MQSRMVWSCYAWYAEVSAERRCARSLCVLHYDPCPTSSRPLLILSNHLKGSVYTIDKSRGRGKVLTLCGGSFGWLVPGTVLDHFHYFLLPWTVVSFNLRHELVLAVSRLVATLCFRGHVHQMTISSTTRRVNESIRDFWIGCMTTVDELQFTPSSSPPKSLALRMSVT